MASNAVAPAAVIAAIAVVLLLMTGSCSAQSLFTDDGPLSRSLFADAIARDVGDIVTIIVFEDARASSKTSKTTDKRLDGAATAGTGLLSFIPAAGVDLEAGSKGSETLAQSGSLTATVTARIVERLENGFLRIEGTRRVTVNGEQQELIVSGIIRERDISPSNSIPSTLVADAEIRFTGKPEIKKSDSVLSRIWSGLLGVIQWIF